MIETIAYHNDSNDYFSKIRNLSFPVFLDSNQSSGRYDIISAWPENIFENTNDINDLFNKCNCIYLKKNRQKTSVDLPFMGGLIGFISYDIASQLENICIEKKSNRTFIGEYLWALIQDHKNKKAYLFFDETLPSNKKIEIKSLLKTSSYMVNDFQCLSPFISNTDKSSYQQQFNKIKDYIYAGDCYQINLARHFSCRYQGDPYNAYLALRKHSQMPYSVYFKHPDYHILSCSPEQFITLNEHTISTNPMKGTRPRHKNPIIDKAIKHELQTSKKDQAENVMIVDLLRNDLSHVCQTGSIITDPLFELETFKHVYQLTSTIQGKIKKDILPLDALKACLPGGSITGAPKRRAMEIIDELEDFDRQFYCGTCFYLSYNGNMDSNILIRTLYCEDNLIHCWGGGGLVSDSDCEQEFDEINTKVAHLMQIINTLD